MKADRFGSYSIVSTFAGMPTLSRLKSMIAIMLLVAASTMPDRDLAVIVAAVDPILRFQQRLVGLIRRQLLLVIHDRLESKRVGLRL